MKQMSKMHDEDAHDDNLITMETSNQIHTRTQMRAAENAANSHILEPADVDNDTNSPLLVRNPAVTATNEHNKVTLLPSILPPRATSDDDLAAARPSVQHDAAGIDLHANFVDYSEVEIAKALARHSVEIGLPKHYAPNHVVPEGKMRVVGIKAKKISSTKAVLIVRLSLKNVRQMFCTSLEPKTKQGQGTDLSIMTALKITNPGAKPLFDLGVRCKPQSDTTRGMIAAFNSMLGGTIFDASQASSGDCETSEQNPFGDECNLPSSRDPVGYFKGAPDPKHHSQAMRSAMKAEWIKSHTSEMDGLWRHDVFQRVFCSSLTPQDRVFTSCFHYKIKQNGGEFDKCKVRLVVQGQHMRRKGENGVGEYDDFFSPVLAASGFRTILSLATQQNMFTDHVDIPQAFVQGELLPRGGHNGKVYISSPSGYDKDPLYVYRLLEPLYGMPSAARAWHTTMRAFLEKEGCATVGFEKSMWTVTIDGVRILLRAHIDDFVITCANRQVLDGFRARLLDAFEGTSEGVLQHYLGGNPLSMSRVTSVR